MSKVDLLHMVAEADAVVGSKGGEPSPLLWSEIGYNSGDDVDFRYSSYSGSEEVLVSELDKKRIEPEALRVIGFSRDTADARILEAVSGEVICRCDGSAREVLRCLYESKPGDRVEIDQQHLLRRMRFECAYACLEKIGNLIEPELNNGISLVDYLEGNKSE
jgi:hypothetical protein